MKRNILITTAIVLNSMLHAATYYVATNGNDANAGTQASPWKTIQKAANVTNAGDNVYVRGGTYAEQVNITRSGGAGNYITFSAYPGESVVLDANGKVSQWEGGIHITANWIKISGFEIINSYWCGVWIKNSQNVVIRKCSTHLIQRTGLYAESSTYITYDSCTVYDTQKAGFSGGAAK